MQYPEINFIGVALDGDKVELVGFVEDHGVGGLPHISSTYSPDETSDLAAEYGVTGIPTFAMIQENGDVEIESGWSEQSLIAALDQLAAS